MEPAAVNNDASPGRPLHVAFFLDHLRGGGIQKMRLIIAKEMARRGHRVDLVVCEAEGPLRAQVPEQVRVVELGRSARPAAGWRFASAAAPAKGLRGLLALSGGSATLPWFPALVGYLRDGGPDALYAATPHMNIEAAAACREAGAGTRLIVSEHNTLTPGHPLASGINRWLLPALLRHAYGQVDAVVGVSNGVADDVAARSGLPRGRITTIYNPSAMPGLAEKARQALDHPWFAPGEPQVILGAGRLGKAKDFPNLIRAFALVRSCRPARLLILGEGKHPKKTAKRKAELLALARELGVEQDVALPGFAQNPYRYMARAGVFVLSSVYEGLPNVLIEAMASGCPVVSTDCPSGPMEILENGKYGPLVPVGDHRALAEAIAKVLADPPDREWLRARAGRYTVEQAVDRYEGLLYSGHLS